MPSGYFRDDLDDCGTGSKHISCQEIWGINTGEFVDVTLSFPKIETANNTSDLIQSVTLKDTNKTDRNFNASIVREAMIF